MTTLRQRRRGIAKRLVAIEKSTSTTAPSVTLIATRWLAGTSARTNRGIAPHATAKRASEPMAITRFVRLVRGITAAYRWIRWHRVAVASSVVETIQRDDETRPADYRRNFTGGLIHGVFFQLSEAFSNINTVLPSFIATLTGSTVVIGLMVVAQEVGHVLPQMVTAYRVEDRKYEKPILMWIITMRWVSWALLAVVTALFALDKPELVLILLVGLFAAFSLAGGVGSVVYADVFAKAIPTQKRGRFIGWKQLIGYTLAI